ncbi:FUSC family protein [Leucobacter luti]|uniref:FUSC family protein n=1 Tax=Leucobacter luti TaxID=340320 RepID=UPI0013004F77|nr:FUSC family protein [Leucobacter luti]
MRHVAVRLSRVVAALDPGHARLVRAVALTCGVLASVLAGWATVHLLGANSGMIAASVFLSLQAGNLVKDRTPAQRLLTTALLLPAVLAAILLAAAASSLRPFVMVGFIVLSGAAIWVRRYGARAAALGAIAFIGYFFTLFMRPEGAALGALCLIATWAVGSQVLVRAVLLARRPGRELRVLLDELRLASAAVTRDAARSPRPAEMRALLARADTVGRALTQWQDTHSVPGILGCSDAEFERGVLDARVTTESAAFELMRLHRTGQLAAAEHRALAQLNAVLTEPPGSPRFTSAAGWARGLVDAADRGDLTPAPGAAAALLIAHAACAHVWLRALAARPGPGRASGPARETAAPAMPSAGSGPSVPPAAAAAAHAPVAVPVAAPASAPHPAVTGPAGAGGVAGRGWGGNRKRRGSLGVRGWRAWSAQSRLAVQAMIAATLASVVGEALSASRWYWAVMTAFVIFIGVGTRGSILTRAVRRVTGTFGGIALGVLAVAVGGDSPAALSIIALIAVFGVLYFGPLNYVYVALWLTTMLVAIYRMLGTLSPELLELRAGETLIGAVVGVLCAYLVLSASSRPQLTARVNAYFDALDALLRAVSEALSAPSGRRLLGSALKALEDRQAELDDAVAGVSTALALERTRGEADAVHLMFVVTRAAARLVQSLLVAAPGTAPAPAAREREPAEVPPVTTLPAGTPAVEGLSAVAAAAAAARHALTAGPGTDAGAQAGTDAGAETDAGAGPDASATRACGAVEPFPAERVFSAAVPGGTAQALATIDWALRRVAALGGGATSSRRPSRPASTRGPGRASRGR